MSTSTVNLFHVNWAQYTVADKVKRSGLWRKGGYPQEIPMDGTPTDANIFGEPFYEVGVTCPKCKEHIPNAVRVYPEMPLDPWRWQRAWLLLVPIIGWLVLHFYTAGSRQKAHLGKFRVFRGWLVGPDEIGVSGGVNHRFTAPPGGEPVPSIPKPPWGP